MISAHLVAIAECPDCRGRVAHGQDGYLCENCGRSFASASGFLDLRPLEAFKEQTKYLDDALHADARHESIAPPLLGSKIRSDMLKRFLRPGPADRVIDLGCGSGRTLAWHAGSGASLTGIDIAPYFAAETIATFDLLLGDLRRLPLRNGAFDKAWSLDVLEHLSRPALVGMLTEANRVLADQGALFVYTHVRKNGAIAIGTRLVNRFAAFCERLGLLDLRQERLRKSDHVNPLADHDDLAAVAAQCGFHIERVTYYTPIIGAFVENVLVRMAEKALAKRAERNRPRESVSGSPEPVSGPADGNRLPRSVSDARREAQARVRKRGLLYRALVGVSWLMKLDIVLFGRLRSGPFFALLRKTSTPAALPPSHG